MCGRGWKDCPGTSCPFHTVHIRRLLFGLGVSTVCQAGVCLLLSVDSQFREVFASKGPGKAEAPVLQPHLVPVFMDGALQDLTPDGSSTASCHTGV